ncbi:MAG TPA: hypothetical protein VNO31_37135, partial [Umezawaea sp.]|nr:hypothetical protein [Umezawaea sp.]
MNGNDVNLFAAKTTKLLRLPRRSTGIGGVPVVGSAAPEQAVAPVMPMPRRPRTAPLRVDVV